MSLIEKADSLRSLLVDFLEKNPYMFDFGGEITDPSTQYPSAMKPSVIVKTTQCQFVENITWAVENDYETEAEALAWFDEWKQSEHGKNETRRLAFLRAIREEVSA